LKRVKSRSWARIRAGGSWTMVVAWWKAQAPIAAESGSVTRRLARRQPRKASSPTEARVSGKTTREREAQPEKELCPIERRPAGRSMEARAEQPRKA